MASFASVFKGIGHAMLSFLNMADAAAPEIAMIPGPGPAISGLLQAAYAVEQIVIGAKQGAVKKQVVTAVMNANQPGLDQSKLSEAIDEAVAGLNAIVAAQAKLQPAK